MKLITLLIPAYMPRPYEGATPVPYQSGIVDKWEKQFAEISPAVLRLPNVVRLLPDPSGRFAHPQIVTPYQVLADSESDTAGNAIALALKVFTLAKLTVFSQDTLGEDFNTEDAANLATGLHSWNEES
jgi:hypothetical protein